MTIALTIWCGHARADATLGAVAFQARITPTEWAGCLPLLSRLPPPARLPLRYQVTAGTVNLADVAIATWLGYCVAAGDLTTARVTTILTP